MAKVLCEEAAEVVDKSTKGVGVEVGLSNTFNSEGVSEVVGLDD